ncbi:MAG: cellulase family glycosylhydrolase [Candidatus Eremiobacteraeota bacterium]|nr:cellulase family glycosylhydrolase [Candidatus Eremiobacteraeota bacterium]
MQQRMLALVRRLFVRDGYFRDEAGAPVYLVGANFWPKRTGPWMYRDPWDLPAVTSDLRELAALHTNVVRLFCFLPDFMPDPKTVAPQAVDRLCASVQAAASVGLWSIPTFLVGHMSGENWSPEWGAGRDWYTDEIALAASELLLRTIGQRLRGDPNVAAWLLTNEWPLFAGRTSDVNGIGWARRLCAALREVDPGAAISLGDGAWDVIGGERSGLPTRELASVVDFYGPHFYPKETDALRHSVFASFAMRMLQMFGKPVLLEEFGCSSDQADDQFAADYYRTTLWSAFGAGNCGTLAWNSHDFTIADRPPYAHHPYELHFGLLRTDGSSKPQATEFSRFAAFVRDHDLQRWQPEQPRIAVGRSSYYLTEYPFDWGWTRPQQRDLFLQTYSSLVRADIDATFVDLNGLRSTSADAVLVPCLQSVTTADADAMDAFVRGGGTLYLSYGGEPWHPNLAPLIGARPLIRYGLVRQAPDTVRFTFRHALADVSEGDTLSWNVQGELRRAAPLPVEVGAATVVAVDQDGLPALLEHRLGSGRVIFVTYPLEYYALHGIDANLTDETWRLYRAVVGTLKTGAAGDDLLHLELGPAVQKFVWCFARDERRRRLLFVNHSWTSEPVQMGGRVQLTNAESRERLTNGVLELAPKGVCVIDAMLQT